MEQAVLERRVRVIPATKPAPASGPRHSGRQRVAAYCRVSTDSEEQLNSYAAQQNYYTQKIEENPDWEMAGIFADMYNQRLIQCPAHMGTERWLK